jgi:hypothetical protein
MPVLLNLFFSARHLHKTQNKVLLAEVLLIDRELLVIKKFHRKFETFLKLIDLLSTDKISGRNSLFPVKQP